MAYRPSKQYSSHVETLPPSLNNFLHAMTQDSGPAIATSTCSFAAEVPGSSSISRALVSDDHSF